MALLAAAGAAVALVHVGHAVGEAGAHAPSDLAIHLPALLAVGVVVTVVLVDRRPGLRRHGVRITGWSLLGAAGTASVGALTALSLTHTGLTEADWVHAGFIVLNGGSVGAFAGVVVGVYDVQRRRTERRLREEQARIDRLNDRLRVLNRVLRHDLRNEVNVIHGYATLLADETSDASYAAVIRNRAKEMLRRGETARQVEQLLDVDGPAAVDVGTTVSNHVAEACERFPEATVEASVPESRSFDGLATPLLGAAVSHLLENAVVHNPASSPRVWVSVEADDELVHVRVADDGPGIPPAERAVFERGCETDLDHASGLGLWFVDWVARESGGEVRLADRDPSGSVVTLAVPQSPSDTGAESSLLDSVGVLSND